jgi:putative copper export protein
VEADALAQMEFPGRVVNRPPGQSETRYQALPLILVSIGVFLVTGTYLLLTDDRFLGLGHFFGGTWSTLIVVKHVLVVALVGIGVYIDLLVVPDVANPVDEASRSAGVRRLARSASAMAALGATVLLLTAAAQAS